jgi:GT2 family glycosyltransferase
MAPTTIAVLMATRNRRDQTLSCLESLFASAEAASTDVHVWLTDDGSTDGTPESVRELFPSVTVLAGDGTLYWAAAMARAEQAATAADPDYIMWLNDDVVLDSDALSRLLAVARSTPHAIVVGAMRDPVTGAMTYGGRRRAGRHPQRFVFVPPSTPTAQPCDTFSGNCVLIPRTAHRRVGHIDSAFPHAYADDDYGLRARAAGVPILQCPGTVGSCEGNPPPALPRGLRSRWVHLQSPKGLPIQAQVRYLRRHGGALWPVWLVGGLAKRLTA